MAIIETVKTRGSASTATLSGNIVIDEGAGELRVYKTIDGIPTLATKIDAGGTYYYDANGVLRATISQSEEGHMRILTYDEDGRGITIMGQAPDGEPIIASTVSGYDVEEELSGGALSFSFGNGNDDNNLDTPPEDIPPVPFNGE